jgi:D-amino-acid dehydrogenase
VIIGGGIAGLCAAWYLSRRDQPVVVLERDRIAGSASAGNAGIVALGHLPLPRAGLMRKALRWLVDPASPLYIRLRPDAGLLRWLWGFARACTAAHVAACMATLAVLDRATLDCWQEILSLEDLPSGWSTAGWLEVFRTPEGRKDARRTAEMSRHSGFTAVELGADELREREPAFGPSVLGAVHYPESRFLDPGAFLGGLARALAVRGVELREGTAVERIVVRRGRCVGVKVATGEELPVRGLVAAAGAWTGLLTRRLGLALPMEGGKGYHLDLPPPQPRLCTACVLNENSVAITPLPERLRLAGTLELSGLNLRLRPRRLALLHEHAVRYLPALAVEPRLEEGCGLRPCTADGLPVLGPVAGAAGLVIATGGAKMGLTLGPVMGRLASEILLDGRPSLDLPALRADRF